MINRTSPPWLLLLCNLRWLAIVGQVVVVAVVTGPMGVALPAVPLWTGMGTLALFNVYATWRARRGTEADEAEVFAHVLVDILVLAWVVGWSGGVENPFSSLFLLPVALSILALRGRWIWATAAASLAGFAGSAVLARPLPHVHGVFGDTFTLPGHPTSAAALRPIGKWQPASGSHATVVYIARTARVIWSGWCALRMATTVSALAAQIFVGALGASNHTYVEATATQSLPDWIGSHVGMYAYWAGVPCNHGNRTT
jgi:hypothetical protein